MFTLVDSSPINDVSPRCTDVVVPITVSATNIQIPVATPGVIVNLPVQGTFNIAARYCEPKADIPSRRKTLQFLVHGLAYTRNYWSGDGPPGSGFHGDQYSWIAYASKEGYPTLSIDRLGSGLSDHPDPLSIVQIPVQVEIIHQLILKARTGSLLGHSSRAFNKVIYAGHSFGSLIGNNLNTKYPQDADATILTGYSSTANVAAFLGFSNATAPSAIVNPEKFGSLPPGYLSISNQTFFQKSFYYPNSYDPTLFALDYSLTGTVAVGEVVNELLAPSVAAAYTGPVFVITGQHDAVYCTDPNPLPPPDAPFATFDCGGYKMGFLAQTKELYPVSSSFKWHAPVTAGHCWHLHYEAQATFAVAHVWMAQNSF